jgi:chlorite dismutase
MDPFLGHPGWLGNEGTPIMSEWTEEKVDLREKGRSTEGQPLYSERRLYFQLLVFGGAPAPGPLVEALSRADFDAVLYADASDPQNVGLLVLHEDPEFFPGALRAWLRISPFASLPLRADLLMFGRTYAMGYENDLDHVLVNRPRKRALAPEYTWAVWYPLRRSGAFARLDAKTQREILMEHGNIGASYGALNLAHDIRLACFGMDRNDNDFLVGLIGSALHPLSAIVERMRKTRQTSEFIEKLGPFFIGRVIFQSPLVRA